MIIGSGYDYSVGGAQGSGFTGGSLPYFTAYADAGVSLEKWLSWSAFTQEKWLQNYNRTEAQATYYSDSPQAYAWQYISGIDDITDRTKDILEDPNTKLYLLAGLATLILLRR